jgi:pyruvate formate lyase activating enzyme
MMKEAPSEVQKKLAHKRVRCLICPRFCTLKAEQRGYCGLYVNVEGVLQLEQYGAVTAVFPSNHGNMLFHPDKQLLQVNIPGCNSGCKFCWYAPYVGKSVEHVLPYAGNKPFAHLGRGAYDNLVLPRFNRFVPPKQLIKIMTHTRHEPYGAPLNPQDCHGLNFTYVEPAINLSYVLEASKLCHEAGGVNLLSTSGALSLQTAELLSEQLDSVRVSFKSNGDADFYRANVPGIPAKAGFECAKLFKDKGVFVQIINTFKVGEPVVKLQRWVAWVVENLGVETPVVAGAIRNWLPNRQKYYRAIERAAKQAGLLFFFLDDNNTPFSMKCPKCARTIIKSTVKFSTAYHLNMKIYEAPSTGDSLGDLAQPIPMDEIELNIDAKGRCLKCGCQTPIIR